MKILKKKDRIKKKSGQEQNLRPIVLVEQANKKHKKTFLLLAT